MDLAGHSIDKMKEADIENFCKIKNEGFQSALKKLAGGSIGGGKREGDRLIKRFYRPDCITLVLRDSQGEIHAGIPLQKCGSRSIPGPLAVAKHYQQPWKSGVARVMLDNVFRLIEELECGQIDSVTFPHSITHFNLYWPLGSPVGQAIFLSKKLSAKHDPHILTEPALIFERHPTFDEPRIQNAHSAIQELTGKYYPGYNLMADVLHVRNQKIGEVFLAWHGNNLEGFAVCHYGENSESFAEEQFLIKHLYINSESLRPELIFNSFLKYIEDFAKRLHFKTVALMVSSICRLAIHALMENRYKITEIHEQWFMLHPYSNESLNHAISNFLNQNRFASSEWR